MSANWWDAEHGDEPDAFTLLAAEKRVTSGLEKIQRLAMEQYVDSAYFRALNRAPNEYREEIARILTYGVVDSTICRNVGRIERLD